MQSASGTSPVLLSMQGWKYLHPHLAGNALSNNTFIIACFNALALYMYLSN